MSLFNKAVELSDTKARIDEILNHCIEKNSPLGYFAALYSIVARNIEKAIEDNKFSNNERLAKMDVNFVNYYIDAMNCAFESGEAAAHWQVVIDASENQQYLVLQHLLISMNAHINYDLSNAVAETVPQQEIIDFQSDFMLVNEILFSLLDRIQISISNIFHPLRWYLKFGMAFDDKIVAVIMGHMRNDAFAFTCILSLANKQQRESENNCRQADVISLSRKILTVGSNLHLILLFKFSRSLEGGDVKEKIQKMLK